MFISGSMVFGLINFDELLVDSLLYTKYEDKTGYIEVSLALPIQV